MNFTGSQSDLSKEEFNEEPSQSGECEDKAESSEGGGVVAEGIELEAVENEAEDDD